MFNFLSKIIKEKILFKYIFLLLLILTSLFFAFNFYPPIIGSWEGSEIYKNYFPFNKPFLMLSISEDPSSTGAHNTFGYAGLIIGRYFSDYFGHTLFNIRMPSIIYGLISLFLFYIIVRRWFDFKIAAISTFLLSTNYYFLIFQHTLLPQMLTVATILFTIERFQILLKNDSKFSIFSFGFACALTTLNYWTGRWCMLSILFFYLIDFEKFSFLKYKSYIYFTNFKRIKTILFVLLSTIFILTIFYPGNIFLLLSSDFIYPSVRIGDYSDDFLESLYNVGYNLLYYFNFYFINNFTYPSEILANIPYRIENIIILSLFVIGIIFSFFRKFNYSIFFFIYIFFVTFIPPLFSNTITDYDNYEASSSLTTFRVIYSVPFICLLATLGGNYIYSLIYNKSAKLKSLFIILILIFLFFRAYDYFKETTRFKNFINSYHFDISLPANSDKISVEKKTYDFSVRREQYYDQIYFYNLSQYIFKKLQNIETRSNKPQFLYISEDMYTPSKFGISGTRPTKGYPYYFPMFLTFHLQQQGINVSYLVKDDLIKESFSKKVIDVLDRYKEQKKSGENFNEYFPRNDSQKLFVEVLVNIINFIERFESVRKWTNSLRNKGNMHLGISKIGDYFVNVTSNEKPDYIIISNKKQFNQIRDNYEYKVVLKLPENNNL
tara:strand:+ start:435 stop:2423 length:1989 start_codon:yes stop_codon:yes gene_type:complete